MSEISVVVVGSTSINSVVGNGDTVNVNVGNQTTGGGNGAAATIEAGTVTTIDATQTATVTNVGTAYAAKFNFSLPRGLTGVAGPANSLSISKVSTGATAAVSISGTAPSQQLSFVLQPGPTGSTGPANSLSIGSVTTGTTAAVSITGSAPSQSISFVLPQGPAGTPNSLSIGSVSTGATAAVSISGSAPSQSLSFVLQPGPTGPANSLSISSVSTGATAAVSISGSAPSQSLSFVLQPGPVGPANSLSIGSVTTGTTAAVSISGTAPSQSLSFVLPPGPRGERGDAGPAGPPINLADETPQPLGTASAGTALAAARADHVHAVPSIAYSSLTGIPSTFDPSPHQHVVGDVTGLQTQLDGKQAAGNYATLVGGTVPSSQLPSYVDDVVEYANLAGFPATGETGKILVARDTGKIYRWSGSAYVEISPSPGSTDSVTEGSVNLYFTNARAAAAAPVQSVSGRTGTITLTKSDVGLGNVPDTDATARSNHTGTQTASTISDFATEAAKHGPVTSVNGQTGSLSIVGGAGVTVSTASSTITIAAGGGGGSGSIVEAVNPSGFPATGVSNTIYIARDASRAFRYDESGVYIEVGSGSSVPAVVAPDSPTALVATRGDSNITLSWTAPAVNGGSAIIDYVVQYAQSGTTNWQTYADATSTATSVTLLNLTNGVSYQLRVAAVNAVGAGSFATLAGTVLVAAANLVGSSSGSGSLNASWTGAGDFGGHLRLVSAYYNSNVGNTVAVITALTSGTMYYYYTSTGSAGRSVRVEKNSSTTISTTQDDASFDNVTAGDVIRFYFYPAAAGDRITIDAYI